MLKKTHQSPQKWTGLWIKPHQRITRQAVIRFEKVMAYLNGEKERYAGVPARTLHRWVARFREAEEQLGSGYVGLLSRKASQGNREPKAPSKPRELMDTFIAEQFETPRHPLAATVYRAYEQECRKRNFTPLSARAFYHPRDAQRAEEGGEECLSYGLQRLGSG